MLQKIKKAQSIVEYLLVFAGVVLAIIWGANNLGGKAKEQMQTATKAVNNTTSRMGSKLGI